MSGIKQGTMFLVCVRERWKRKLIRMNVVAEKILEENKVVQGSKEVRGTGSIDA